MNTERIVSCGVRFDERFAFHFYDLDFCRESVAKGLTLGTWPRWVVHRSGGTFQSPEWKQAAHLYQRKWMVKA